MPRDMFGDVVDPSIKLGSQKWYTVPLSILAYLPVFAAGMLAFEIQSRDALARHLRTPLPQSRP